MEAVQSEYKCRKMHKLDFQRVFTFLNPHVENLTLLKDIKDHIRWEGEKYVKLDSKYSGKWVEKLTLAIAGGLVIAILTFLLK